MLTQILLAFGLACVTVAMHACGTVYVILPATGLWRAEQRPKPAGALSTLTLLISMLLVLHLLEMGLWAATFAVAGVLPDAETALYYSMTSYTTVGYGDVVPSVSRRLLGPIEAAVGVLMMGWSTGIIVAVVQRLQNARRTDERWP